MVFNIGLECDKNRGKNCSIWHTLAVASGGSDSNLTRSHLINVERTERSISSGAKAHFFLAFDVGAKAPTPQALFYEMAST